MQLATKLHFKNFLSCVGVLLMFFTSSASFAQPSPERLKLFYANYTELETQAGAYSDLKFDASVQKIGMFTNYVNGLIVPDDFDATKKYPALIVMPTCAGVRASIDTVKAWVELAVKNKMVVYSLDTMRDKKANCIVPFNPGMGRIAKDALDTTSELSKLSFVDAKNIFALGESLGAMTALVAASDSYANRLSPNTPRLSAVISIYGRTVAPLKKLGADKDAYILDRDTNTPILFLAGDLDTETPPEDDLETFEAFKSKGKSNLEVHILKDATHCWNCKSLNGFTKKANNGRMVSYTYSQDATDRANSLVLNFIAKYMK